MPRFLRVDHLHQPGGWLSPGYLALDEAGWIDAVGPTPPPGWDEEAALQLSGFAIPAMPNLHSHAFQRAMAGLAERRAPEPGADSFWTWRETMYDQAQRIGPDDLEAVAAWVYVEMLKTGMTAVGEFHYLHHRPDGSRYDDPAELTRRILRAAETSGIALTHLPVLYLHGGIGRPVEPRQRRFAHADLADFLALVPVLAAEARTRPLLRTGLALHSLRAVAPDELREAVDAVKAADEDAPVHIHVAEQRSEVAQCSAALGAPPVRWLLDHAEVDRTWCLVHATHAGAAECEALARSGAVAGLCPTTEANLGDGVFPLADFLEADGSFGIGTDSQVSVGAAAELRLLEYGQRLTGGRRNVAARADCPHTGRFLWDAATLGGARALGQPIGRLVPGRRADLVVLDGSDPRLIGHTPETLLDAFLFSSAGTNPVRDVLVAGEPVVRGGRHVREDRVRAAFEQTMDRLQRPR